MVEGRKGEERGSCSALGGGDGDGAPTPTPTPNLVKKRLFAGLKQSGMKSPKSSSSSSAPYPFRLRNPNLSNCHVCDCRNRGKDKLQTLDSQWRIVLLCKSCFKNVQSAKICSYCFDEMMSDVGAITCCYCKRRVHETCFYKYRGFNVWNDADFLVCIDCWVPKSPNGPAPSRKPTDNNNNNWGDSESLEDAAKDANSTAEMKKSAAVNAKEKALTKAVAAKRAAEMAANALDFAWVAARKETLVKGSGQSLVDDAELAFRLHRAINSSTRIINNLSAMKLKTTNCDDECSLPRKFDPEYPMVCGDLKASNDNMVFRNTDKFVSEPSVHIVALGQGSSLDFSFLEHQTMVDAMVNAVECKRKIEDGVKITYKRRLKAGLAETSESKDCTKELPMKEEQERCSSKVASSTETSSSVDSGSQSAFDEDSSPGHNKFVRKYSRRGRGTDKCFKRYNRRNTSLKTMLDRKTKFPLEDLPLDSRASAPGLPLLEMNCSKVATFYNTSFRSPSVPLTAPAPSSGPSQS